jgi:hypothetical protein
VLTAPPRPRSVDARHSQVAGQSGLGRTTFVNTLCEQPVLKGLEVPSPQEAHLEGPLVIRPTTVGASRPPPSPTATLLC